MRNVLRSAVLGSDGALRAELKTKLAALAPCPVGHQGRLLEGRTDYAETEPGHRHLSPLSPLSPSEEITPRETPELATAAKKALVRRLDPNGGGTSGTPHGFLIAGNFAPPPPLRKCGSRATAEKSLCCRRCLPRGSKLRSQACARGAAFGAASNGRAGPSRPPRCKPSSAGPARCAPARPSPSAPTAAAWSALSPCSFFSTTAGQTYRITAVR